MKFEEQISKVIKIVTSDKSDDSKASQMGAFYQPWLTSPETFAAAFGTHSGEVKRICGYVGRHWRQRAESNLIEQINWISDADLKKIIDQISAERDAEGR